MTRPPAKQWTSSPAYDQSLFTSSSEGQASLHEIWKILDAEESFKSPTPRKASPSSTQRPTVARELEPDHIPVHDSPEHDVFALKGRREGEILLFIICPPRFLFPGGAELLCVDLVTLA